MRAELQRKQSQLQVQIAVVKSRYQLLTPNQRAALAAPAAPPPAVLASPEPPAAPPQAAAAEASPRWPRCHPRVRAATPAPSPCRRR